MVSSQAALIVSVTQLCEQPVFSVVGSSVGCGAGASVVSLAGLSVLGLGSSDTFSDGFLSVLPAVALSVLSDFATLSEVLSDLDLVFLSLDVIVTLWSSPTRFFQ